MNTSHVIPSRAATRDLLRSKKIPRFARDDIRSFVIALLLLPGLSLAQGSITGIVRDSVGRPIAGAEVMVVSPERRVRTDSTGSFAIAALPAGTYELRARRLGYFAANTSVVLREGAAKRLIFELPKRPIMLDTVRVTAACARFEFAGFVCRRRAGNASGKGVFFDAHAIDSANPRFPIDMMRDVPGVKVVAVPGGRGLGLQSPYDWKCAFVVLANGKKPTLQNQLPRWPNETLGIEVYATPKDVPSEYSHFISGRATNTCGLVNYWTVVRPRTKSGTVRDTTP